MKAFFWEGEHLEIARLKTLIIAFGTKILSINARLPNYLIFLLVWNEGKLSLFTFHRVDFAVCGSIVMFSAWKLGSARPIETQITNMVTLPLIAFHLRQSVS